MYPSKWELEREDRYIVDSQAIAPKTRRLKTSSLCYEDSPYERSSDSSLSLLDSVEEDDDVISVFSNLNIPPFQQDLSCTSTALDLDRCLWSWTLMMDHEPDFGSGPSLDHGLEDGFRPYALVKSHLEKRWVQKPSRHFQS